MAGHFLVHVLWLSFIVFLTVKDNEFSFFNIKGQKGLKLVILKQVLQCQNLRKPQK